MSEILQPPGWPRPSGFSNGIVKPGRVLVVAGQVGWNPLTNQFESDDFVAQTRQALLNIAAVLQIANAKPRHVVRLTWYVTNRDAYVAAAPKLGAVYREVFGTHYPAMSLLVVAGLLEPRALVEIEATALIPTP